MSYTQALTIAYDRQLFGAQAYNLARSSNASAKTWFEWLCHDAAMKLLAERAQ